jgi:hypothetical protein
MSNVANDMMALRAAVSTLSDKEAEIESHALGEITIKTVSETLWTLNKLLDKRKADRERDADRTTPAAQD